MIETQLVFKNEYRFDLTPGKSVLIPYLFTERDRKLILTVRANPSRSYRSSGNLEQILFDLPNKPVGDSRILRFGKQFFEFLQQGNFKLVFSPNLYLGKTTLEVYKTMPLVNSTDHTELDNISSSVAFIADESVKLVDENSSRRILSIFNASESVLDIGLDVDADNNLQDFLVQISPKSLYEFPSDNGVYSGSVYGRSNRSGIAYVNEFVSIE
jgi:hypothetical protein